MKIVSIIIPAYNEENTIGILLEKVIKVNLSDINFQKEIIVIDDGSTDRTADICKEFKNIKLVKQNNKGKGDAVRNGIKNSSGDYILIQDADLEYDPNYYKNLLNPFVQNKEGISVFGSRYRNENMTLRKKPFKGQQILPFAFNNLLSLFFFILYGKYISDLLTGYKVYEKKFFDNNKIYTNGFETDHEITVKLIKNKIKIVEIPIKYYPRSKKEGKKITFLDAIKALMVITKYRIFN